MQETGTGRPVSNLKSIKEFPYICLLAVQNAIASLLYNFPRLWKCVESTCMFYTSVAKINCGVSQSTINQEDNMQVEWLYVLICTIYLYLSIFCTLYFQLG